MSSDNVNLLQLILSFAAGVCAVSYPLYSLFRKEKTLAGFFLFLAFLSTAVLEFSDILSLLSDEPFLWKRCSLIAEGFLPATWLSFTLLYARDEKLKSPSISQRVLVAFSLVPAALPLVFPVELFFYSPDLTLERMLFLGTWGFAYYLVLLVWLIISLINLEVTLTSASITSRWKIKFEIFGAGFLLAALIFYYSQGLLYRTINMNLIPVRTVALLVAVLLVAYAQLRRNEGARIQVARTLVYKSVVLVTVGVYLISLGLMGEGLRFFGEPFKRAMVVAIGFISGIVFLVALFSETVKRKINVFLYKNFYQNKYDYRLQWLQFTDRLSNFNSGEQLLSSIIAGYCETFGMGCGCLFLAEHENDRFSLAATLEMEQIDRLFSGKDELILFLVERKWVVNLFEGLPGIDSGTVNFLRRKDMAFVIPLFAQDVLEGIIILGRPLNRNESYNFEDYDLMKTFARQTSWAITNLRLSDQLVQAREMEAIGKISAFVIHDLKNLVYTLSLVTDNAKDYIADPEFQHDMLESLDNTIGKMRVLIDKLKYLPEKNVLQKESTDLLGMAKEAAGLIPVEIQVTGEPVTVLLDREEMQKVVINLLINAVDAMGGEGPVTLEVGDDGRPFIRVRDRGAGIPTEFMPCLFRPFTTTKKKGLGIGLYQCKQIVEAHDGKIEVETELGSGTTFTVRI